MSEDLTPREVARELGVTVRTVQRWIADGRLAASRVGSRVRVSRSSLSSVADARPAPHRPITTLLIANRGEIAVRVARSARRMGLRVIGVHAADERAPTGTDESHEIGSYLDPDDAAGGGAQLGRRRHPSRVRLPGRERRVCSSGGGVGDHLGRAAAGGHRRHGRQGGRTAAGGGTRRPRRSGLRRSSAGRRDPVRRGRAHRLPAARQAQRRRWRQGHARGERGAGARRGAGRRSA